GRADFEELVTVNGTVAPTIPIRPGEAQFWQLGHIGADRFLRVKVEGMPFYVIGRDGYFLPRPIRQDEVLLGPGQRASVIVIERLIHALSADRVPRPPQCLRAVLLTLQFPDRSRGAVAGARQT